jgi:uncharacterized membrane protein
VLSNDTTPNPDEQPDPKLVWTYSRYHLETGIFTVAMVHLYWGELARVNAWRCRLNVTTKWAVVLMFAALTFVFGQRETHYSVIILISGLVTLFLIIEARRYRYYEMWLYRVRLIETNFFAAMVMLPFCMRPDWSKKLSNSLMNPRFPISFWEAFGRRLRRTYVWIYLILALAWLSKLLILPTVK